jgi:hypothetical protein
MKGQSSNLLGRYLWVLMGGLLLQGLGSLIFRLMPALPAHSPLLLRGAFGIDFWHALIHIAWGLVGVVVLAVSQTNRPLVYLALIFGTFYSLLGVWGVLVHHPLGLELDLPENVFHVLAGPLTLAIGWRSLRQASATPALTSV